MEDEEQVPENASGGDIYKIFSISHQSSVNPIMVSLFINNKQLRMEVDTGAAVSVMGQKKFNQLWSVDDRPALRQTDIGICTYTGEEIKPCGEVLVEVSHNYNIKIFADYCTNW